MGFLAWFRLQKAKRVVLPTSEGRSLAEELWHIGSHLSARAWGFDDAGGTVKIDRAARELSLVDDEHLLDAIVFSGTDRIFV